MLLLGNEAIARGAIEAGVAFTSTYPGTPSSEISTNFFQMARESDLYFEFSTNEKVALEVAAAAANSGVRSLAIMKHVGVNVAADALMTLAYVGVTGGLVIISADDGESHRKFREKHKLPFTLLSDPGLKVAALYDSKGIMGVKRSVFLVDKLGVIRYAHVESLSLFRRKRDEILEVIEGLS